MSQNPDHLAIRVAPDLNGRQTARVGYSNVAKEIADHAASKVTTRDDAHAAPGDMIEHALHAQRMALENLHRAITVERMNGTSWETIAGKLRLPIAQVLDQFKHCDLTHLADTNGENGVWRVLAETCVAPVPGLGDPHPGKVALELDDWYKAYASGQPGDPAGAATPNPVTAHL
ncbi:hypothetical protein ACIBKY_03325 [Nonomuraea sp. NPDC050394]|uniref:hypothetical protein n=1 Tax=Nonomuraea sp. NPDC050394 TaxID=3364363 RepID=UPI0037960090